MLFGTMCDVSVHTNGFVDVLRIDRDDLDAIFTKFPGSRQMMLKKAVKSMWRKLMKSKHFISALSSVRLHVALSRASTERGEGGSTGGREGGST